MCERLCLKPRWGPCAWLPSALMGTCCPLGFLGWVGYRSHGIRSSEHMLCTFGWPLLLKWDAAAKKKTPNNPTRWRVHVGLSREDLLRRIVIWFFFFQLFFQASNVLLAFVTALAVALIFLSVFKDLSILYLTMGGFRFKWHNSVCNLYIQKR